MEKLFEAGIHTSTCKNQPLNKRSQKNASFGSDSCQKLTIPRKNNQQPPQPVTTMRGEGVELSEQEKQPPNQKETENDASQDRSLTETCP